MLRFKHFAGAGETLEAKVNQWLEEYEPDVTQMEQTELHNGEIVLSFLFEESFRAQEIRLSREHGVRNAEASALSPGDMPDKPLQVEELGGPLDTSPSI